MKFVFPIDNINSQGYRVPRNIYNQLRLKSDGETIVAVGVAVGGSIGVYEYDVDTEYLSTPLARYVCTQIDGVYEEDLTFGGSEGKVLSLSTFTTLTNEGALYETGFVSTAVNINFGNSIRVVELQEAEETALIQLPDPMESEGRVIDFYCLNPTGGYTINSVGTIYTFTNDTTYITVKCYDGVWRVTSIKSDTFTNIRTATVTATGSNLTIDNNGASAMALSNQMINEAPEIPPTEYSGFVTLMINGVERKVYFVNA